MYDNNDNNDNNSHDNDNTPVASPINPDWTYDNLTKQRKLYVDAVIKHGEGLGIDLTQQTYCRAELRQISLQEKGKKWIPNWITHDRDRRADAGVFYLPEIAEGYINANPEIREEVDAERAKKAERRRLEELCGI